jgi:Tfp pilus assembly protein PilF
VSSKGLDQEQKAEFISKLNGYLIGQIKTSIKEIASTYQDILHEDIAKELREAICEAKEKEENAFREKELERIERLAKEYEFNRDFTQAEKYYKRLILKDKNNSQRWLILSRFYCSLKQYSKAFFAMKKAMDLSEKTQEMLLTFVALLLTQKCTAEAKRVL